MVKSRDFNGLMGLRGKVSHDPTPLRFGPLKSLNVNESDPGTQL